MKPEVGMFYRYKGQIGKYKKITELDKYPSFTNNYLRENEVILLNNAKFSYNIIDLIKSKDIILGRDGKMYQCWKIYKDYVFTYSKNKQGQTITLVDYQINKVLTKEQFEQMAYKVGE